MNHSTELLDALIEGWLDSITSPPQHYDPNLASSSFESKLGWDDMPTPPPSSFTPTRNPHRSPKRPRQDDTPDSPSDRNGFIDDDPFGNDETPVPSSRVHNLPTMSLPGRPLRQTPSLSSASSARSSNGRSASPVKRSTLQLLKKPVYFVPIDEDPTTQLPEDILPTYDRIIDISHHQGFLPRAVEAELKATHRRNLIKPHWFFDHGEDGASTATHIKELMALREIEQAAKTCQTEEASEAAWNVEVHAPLLKLALAPFPSLSRDILTSARISKPFVPDMHTASHYDFTRSKMIDWGIRGHPSPSTSARIRDVLLRLPDNQRSVNQTTYGPVRFEPVGISIETKIARGAVEQARLQLGVWIAAWHKRVSILSQSPIITLPLILIMEHEWHLLLACDKGDRIDIVEGIAIGDTRGSIGMYIILAVLRALASWMQDEYMPWVERLYVDHVSIS